MSVFIMAGFVLTLARHRKTGSSSASGAPWKESGMPSGPKRRTPPQERQAYGLTILHPSHPEVRRIQQDAAQPSLHGHKVWPTSFVLMDYLHQRGISPQARVLELGCGWGLVGIACAKTFQ